VIAGATTSSRGRYCRVLRDAREIDVAVAAARQRGLCASPDTSKSWDNMIAVELITTYAGRYEPIADLGCRSGILLTWLHQLGFRRLYGCDVRLPFPPVKKAVEMGLWRTAWEGLRMYANSRRSLVRRPVEATGLPSDAFAAVACMSVIEHGVDTGQFFAEAARLLRPGGVLFLSTDYWPEKIDLRPSKLFRGAPGFDRIFSAREIEALRAMAAANRFRPLEALDLEAGERLVHDGRASYTFIALAFALDPGS
jgi:SAM-dependent methyltransferase